jgi:hypothetical protein
MNASRRLLKRKSRKQIGVAWSSGCCREVGALWEVPRNQWRLFVGSLAGTSTEGVIRALLLLKCDVSENYFRSSFLLWKEPRYVCPESTSLRRVADASESRFPSTSAECVA